MESKKENGAKQGLADGWTRWTIIIRDDYIDQIKGVAWQEHKTIKDVMDEALTDFLAKKEPPQRKT